MFLAAAGAGLLAVPLVPAAAVAGPGQAPSQAQSQAQSQARSPGLSTTPEPTDDPTPIQPAEEPVARDPLKVTLDRLTPSALTAAGFAVDLADVPRRQRTIVATGEIRNRTDEEWRDLSVYPLVSTDPFSTAEELEAALATDPRAEVGGRLLTPGLYQDLGDLAPGESTPYRLRIPVDQLPVTGAPGVYWFGVHVLATEADGDRIEGADGRVRTFLPLVPRNTSPVPVSLGLQFRQPTQRTATGELASARRWARELGPEGRLNRLVGLGGSASAWPLSWIVDPAVLEAARSVEAGNPGLTPDPEDPLAGTPDQGDSGSAGPADEPDPDQTGGENADDDGADQTEDAAELTEQQSAAADWLEAFVAEATRHPLFTIPYGDLDVAAVVRAGSPALVGQAYDVAEDELDRHGLQGSRVLAPLRGTVSPESFEALGPEVPVILDREAQAENDPVTDPATGQSGDLDSEPVRERTDGGVVVLTDPTLVQGGPLPGPRLRALPLRQRLLAQVAVEALSAEASDTAPAPQVALLPRRWDPGPTWEESRFFAGLDQPWVTPVPLSQALAGTALAVDPDAGSSLGETSLGAPTPTGTTSEAWDPATALTYGEDEIAAEAPATTVAASVDLEADGVTLGEVLVANQALPARLARQALLTSSATAASRPRRAVRRADGAGELALAFLDRITVRGPALVTLSSGTGTFQVTLVNGLDQPVQVAVDTFVAGGGLDVVVPTVRELPGRQRTSLLLEADASTFGLHQVLVRPVAPSGEPVGTPLSLTVRSSTVGRVLWIVMGVTGALLFGVIAVRITRRITSRTRTRRAERALASASVAAPDPDPVTPQDAP